MRPLRLRDLTAEERAAIEKLPETYRTVLLLRDIEELSTDEVAGMLGTTPNAVKIQLHRGRQALRAAHDGNAFPDAGGPFTGRRSSCEIELYVVRDHKIEQSVAVIIDKRATAPPCLAGACRPGSLTDFVKNAMLVVVETVLAVVRDVKVFPSIIVVIASTDPLSPPCRS